MVDHLWWSRITNELPNRGQQIAKGSNKESEREREKKKKMHEKAKTEENKNNNKKTQTFIHLYLPSEQFSPDQPAKQEHFSDSMS